MDEDTNRMARKLLVMGAARIEDYGFAIGIRDSGQGHCALGALDWALREVKPEASQWCDHSNPECWQLAVETLAKTAGATNPGGANCAVAGWSNMSTKERVVQMMREAAQSLS